MTTRRIWRGGSFFYEARDLSTIARFGDRSDASSNVAGFRVTRATSVSRVVRGGSWDYDLGQYLRGADRNDVAPGVHSGYRGFRCARKP